MCACVVAAATTSIQDARCKMQDRRYKIQDTTILTETKFLTWVC